MDGVVTSSVPCYSNSTKTIYAKTCLREYVGELRAEEWVSTYGKAIYVGQGEFTLVPRLSP